MNIVGLDSIAMHDYIPGSMSFADGMMGPRGDVGYVMVVDEELAKEIITTLNDADREVMSASLGLDGDWGCNSQEVFCWDGGYTRYVRYDNSSWATPTLEVNFADGTQLHFPCWKKEG